MRIEEALVPIYHTSSTDAMLAQVTLVLRRKDGHIHVDFDYINPERWRDTALQLGLDGEYVTTVENHLRDFLKHGNLILEEFDEKARNKVL